MLIGYAREQTQLARHHDRVGRYRRMRRLPACAVVGETEGPRSNLKPPRQSLPGITRMRGPKG